MEHKFRNALLAGVFLVLMILAGCSRTSETEDVVPEPINVPVIIPQSDNIRLTPDQDGPDDVPAQSDVTQLGFDDSHLPEYYIAQIQFDDTAYPGGNSGDGCIFFDSDDSGGFADFAVCGSFIQNTTTGQVELQSAALFDCKNSEPNNDEGARCPFNGGGGDGSNGIIAQDLDGDGIFESDGDENPLATPYQTQCSLNTTASDPFNGVGSHNTSGEQDPINDTQLTCQIFADELVELDGDVPTGIGVSNACSFTSPDPSSERKDCVVDPGSGFLQVIKNTTGGNDTFAFTLNGSPFASITTVNGTGSTDALAVDGNATLNLAEVVPEGWVLDSATCDNGDDPSLLMVGPANTVICTFENIPAVFPPNIANTVIKSNDADGDGVFSGAGQTDTDQGSVDSETLASVPGTVTYQLSFYNNSPSPATLDSISDDTHQAALEATLNCDPGTPEDDSDDFGYGAVADPGVTVGAQATVTCTFRVDFADDNQTVTNIAAVSLSNEAGSSPGSDASTVVVPDTQPAITVQKDNDADGDGTFSDEETAEPGADVTFQVMVTNDTTEGLTITELSDDIYTEAVCLDSEGASLVGQTLAAGATLTCTFTGPAPASDNASETDTVTVTVTDDDENTGTGTDTSVVNTADVPATISVVKTADPTSVAEPGGSVEFTVEVTNTSALDTVTLSTIADDVDNDGDDDEFYDAAAICGATELAPGESTTCTFTRDVTGNAGDVVTDKATATGTDDDGNEVSASDTADVTITDVAPTVTLTKSASPESLPEPGGDFTYTLTVKNTSAENVTITALTDDNVLSQECTDLIGDVLTPDQEVSCTYVVNRTDAGSYPNTANVTIVDDDGTEATDTAEESVEVTDVLPTVTLDKSVDVETREEPGGLFTFTLTITNTSVEPVTMTALIDTQSGDAVDFAPCSDLIGTTLGAAGSGSDTAICSYTVEHTQPGSYDNTANVTVEDNEGNPASAEASQTVTVTDVPATIEVVKTATPDSVDEPGGDVTFSFEVNNPSIFDTVTIDTLNDSIYGNLDGQGDCSVPQIITPEGSYSCSITVFVSGMAGETHTNTVTASGTDDDGQDVSATDDATVTINDVPASIEVTKTANPTEVPETGGDVEFTVTVQNTSAVDTVAIETLTDSVFGDISASCTPAIPATLAPGESTTCTFTEFISGHYPGSHTNVASSTGTDDDGGPVEDSDDATVDYTDVLPDVTVTKTASVNEVPETGGDVTFTFVVTNNNSEETTISSLSDSVFGTLAGNADCQVGTALAGSGGSCSFEATFILSGDDLVNHVNVFTAKVCDDDGNCDEGEDDETVTFKDILPEVTVTKTADVQQVPETGGDVTFTFVVTNVNAEATTINALSDSVFGTLSGDGDCQVGTVLAGNGGSCSFEATFTLSGDDLEDHVNVFTAEVCDNDNNCDEGEDDEKVTFEDVLPDVTITKTANPISVDEMGGDVEFTIVVTNNSLENVTIDSLTDSDFDLSANDCNDAVGTVLASGESFTCSFTAFISGNVGDDHMNTATVKASDNDGNTDEESDDATVTIVNALPAITVDKSANPTTVSEPGGEVTFTVKITNDSVATDPVTINSLVDDVHGDLNGQDNCSVPQIIQPSDTYECSFTATVEGNAGFVETDTVTAKGVDDEDTPVEGEDSAEVTVTDVLPAISVDKTTSTPTIDEPGGTASYTIVVTNDSVSTDPVTITSLIDDKFNDLNGQGDCSVPQTIQPDDSYSCEFTGEVTGNAGETHTNIVTASGTDDEGNQVSASDDATVTFNDILPDISVLKTAGSPSVPETGGEVTFTFEVTNNSAEAVEITSLSDNKFGPLTGDSDCQVGTVLAGNASCTFEAAFSIPAGDYPGSHTNTFTAVGEDDEGNSDTAIDDETVDYTDVLPDIAIDKSANPTSVPETGGDVTFTIIVTNNSLENATLDSLTDSDFDLSPECDAAVGTVLAYGETYTCSFSEFIEGDASGPDHENTATVTASDDDGNSDTASDDATVEFTDVLPDISVTKSADPTSVLAPGADVEFTFTVTNNSLEDAVITSLEDDVYGSLGGDGDCQVGTELAYSETCEFMATLPVSGDAYTTHVDTFTAYAEDNDGNEASDSASASVEIRATRSQIAPTQTTCQMYRDGVAETYTELFYNVRKKDSVIQSVAPGVVFFYTTLTAPSSSFTLTADQSNDLNWKDMGTLDVFLWDASCTKVQTTSLSYDSQGNPVLNVSGATAGDTYYLSVKYSPSSLAGITVNRPYPTNTYDFSTLLGGTLISTASIDLISKK